MIIGQTYQDNTRVALGICTDYYITFSLEKLGPITLWDVTHDTLPF